LPGMMFIGFLLLQIVLGDLAPLYKQEKTIDKDGLRSYIVVFADEAPELAKEGIQKWLSMEVPSVDPTKVEGVWNIESMFRGFATYLNAAGLAEIRSHKYIKYVEEDAVVTLDAFTDRQDWGQIRVNQRARNLTTNTASYSYASSYPNQNLDITVWNFVAGVQAQFTQDGSRSSVCVIDTGVRATHQEITGRVDAQINYSSDSSAADGNGHGTHVAGSCCGRFRGVARNSRIASAKVLTNAGSGQNAWVISGINWCANRYNDATRTWVLSLSLGGTASTAVNDAINSAAVNSVPVVAAGNDNGDACTKSPASATRAITVAASDKDDTKASFSNFGQCVNIWAPGVSIHSGWYTGDANYNTISGTSMATPLVSGLVAFFGNTQALKRDQAMSVLQSNGVNGVIRNCPANTPNILAATGRTP